MQYYIRLIQLNEYICETTDSLVWTKSKDINEAFSTTLYEDALNVANFICKDKHLIANEDVEIIQEEIIIEKTRLALAKDQDDWEICPRCMNWVKVDDLMWSSVSEYEQVCPSCENDE
jgi:hypothetical protein